MPRTLRGMAHLHPFIAALSVEITPGQQAVKLLPAGSFRALDGRPKECQAWQLDAASAAALVAAAAARSTRYVIDYEHQTLRSIDNGQPAPAAGWFRQLEWREGDGLYITDLEWTGKASAWIDANEYLYISPVFTYDAQGRVTGLLHVALTNTPALDELPALSVAALSMLGAVSTPSTPEEDTQMEDLIEQLRWLLNLPVGATADDIKTQLQKLIGQLSDGHGMAAASVDLLQLLADKETRIAALSATQADPARYVPLETMRELQGQVATLSAQLQVRDTDGLVTAALSDGRLLPAQEAWARDLAKSNVAALQGYLATAPRIAALSATQTSTTPPQSDSPAQLGQDALAICSMLGNDPAQVAATAAGLQE